MRFGPIDSFVFFGSGQLLLDSASRLAGEGYRVAVFTSPRHLAEVLDAQGTTLASALEASGVPTFESPDINDEPRLAEHVGPTTLGIALGPAWIFRADVCRLFGDRFVNYMGIDLPRYRGGAHYTWQILQGNRRGSVNLQLINEVVDSGAIVKSREFLFPATARVPGDYFDVAERVNAEFLAEFLEEVKRDEDFQLQPIQEKFAQYFPYLSTDRQGWVDWSWTVDEIEVFVNAFGAPYSGASTLLEGQRVRLLGARTEYGDGPFHPFMAGLIYRVEPEVICVACRGGTLLLESVLDEDGNAPTESLRVGRRFHTPSDTLDEAREFRAVYGAKGLKEAGT